MFSNSIFNSIVSKNGQLEICVVTKVISFRHKSLITLAYFSKVIFPNDLPSRRNIVVFEYVVIWKMEFLWRMAVLEEATD